MEDFRKKIEKISAPEVTKGCLAKLDTRDIDAHDLRLVEKQGIHPDIAYRVLAIDRVDNRDGTFTELAWVGENTFTDSEVASFDPLISLDIDDEAMSIYDDVVPVPKDYLRRLLD